jgi:hypothetical protein
VTMPGRRLTHAINELEELRPAKAAQPHRDAELIAAHYAAPLAAVVGMASQTEAGAVIFTSVCAVDVDPRSSAGCVTRGCAERFFTRRVVFPLKTLR